MGVKLILDTHVFLWLLTVPERISADALQVLENRENELIVSAVSALEVSTKIRIGKLTAPGLVDSWSSLVAAKAAVELDITSRHASLAGSFQWEHRDPFDRLLAAQAILENAALVTVDGDLLALPGLRTLTW